MADHLPVIGAVTEREMTEVFSPEFFLPRVAQMQGLVEAAAFERDFYTQTSTPGQYNREALGFDPTRSVQVVATINEDIILALDRYFQRDHPGESIWCNPAAKPYFFKWLRGPGRAFIKTEKKPK